MLLPEEDAQLLRRYADEKSEAAFAELVRRHLGPVYAFALRRVGGDAHLAEDVAQIAFTTLARKALSLADRPVLGGWLCRTAHFAARDLVRTESRRRAREWEAHIMHESSSEDPGAKVDWAEFHPVLARTLGELNDDDRDAVWLRFFEGRSFAEVGARLRLTENAARMRVERALDKLHVLLARQGIASTAAALGVALAGQAGAAVPAGLAASVTGAAVAGGAIGGAAIGGGVIATFMSATKIQIGIIGALVVAVAGALAVQQRTNEALREEVETLRRQTPPIAQIVAENQRLEKAVADVAVRHKGLSNLESLRRQAESYRTQLQEVEVMEERNHRIKQALDDLAVRPLIGPVFDERELDRAPKPKLQFNLVPPRELSRPGLEIDFVFQITIDTEGNVRKITPLRATPRELEPGFVDTMKRWTFVPAQKDGQAVNSRIEVPIRFTVGVPREGTPQTPRKIERVDWF